MLLLISEFIAFIFQFNFFYFCKYLHMYLFILALLHWLVPPPQRWIKELRTDISALFCFQRILLSLTTRYCGTCICHNFHHEILQSFTDFSHRFLPWNLNRWRKSLILLNVSPHLLWWFYNVPPFCQWVELKSQVQMFYSVFWF